MTPLSHKMRTAAWVVQALAPLGQSSKKGPAYVLNIRKLARLFNALTVFGAVFRTIFAFSERFRSGLGDGLANSAYGFGPSRLPWDEELRGAICHYLAPSAPIWSPYPASFRLASTDERPG
jgi:hypothetical protein